MPFCPSCGKQVEVDAKFCPDCGEGFKKGSTSLIAWGYVCGIIALFIFPVGFGIAGVVIGIVNLTRGRVGHGIAQITIAVTLGFLGAVWGALVWGG